MFGDAATLTFAIANPGTVNTPLGLYKLGGYVYQVNPDGSVYVQSGPFGGGLTYTAGSPRALDVISKIQIGKASPVSDASSPAVPATTSNGANSVGPSRPGGNFWDIATNLTQTFAPLIQVGVQEIAQGRKNTTAYIAGQIAKKQAQLARTTDPTKRAQLAAEIQALQQHSAVYAQALNMDVPAQTMAPATGVSSWIPWAVLGVGGVLALAAVTAASGKR